MMGRVLIKEDEMINTARWIDRDTYGIEELGEFANVIPPTRVGHSECHGVVGVVDRLAPETVSFRPATHQVLKQENIAKWEQ